MHIYYLYDVPFINLCVEGADYSINATVAHFIPSRSNRSCVSVTIIDDSILEEEEEYFRVMIHSASGGAQTLEPSDAVIVIIDNDGNVVLDANPMIKCH